MKKLCSECGHINEYEATLCEKCGCKLDENEKYKQCPVCGRTFPLLKDECPDCRETLVVRGRAAAQIFDETKKPKGLGAFSWIFSMLLPIIGFIYALCVSADKVKKGDMSPHERREFCFVSLAAGVVVFVAVYVIVSIVVGNLSL